MALQLSGRLRRRIWCVWHGDGMSIGDGGVIIGRGSARLNSEKDLILEVCFKVRCLALVSESSFRGRIGDIVKRVGMNGGSGGVIGL